MIFFRKANRSPACRVAGLLALFFLATARPARAEFDISIFTGIALTPDNDLDLHLNGGTDLTFHDVPYEGRDFEGSPYYGARLLWFPGENSHWGFGAEYFHIKLFAQTNETVHVSGRRNGVAVDGDERIGDTIDQFNLSHGLNFALADVIYRWFPGPRGPGFPNCLQPYAGLGIGAAIPHVESSINGTTFEEYQLRGPAVQGLVGVNIDLTRHFGLMFEYKLSYAHLGELDIPNGSIALTPLNHNFVGGITVRF